MNYQFAEINGTKIHYDVRGAGTAMVLLHAGVANMGMWEAQMDALAEKHRVVRYDLRGWGKSPLVPGEFSAHEDLRALLVHLGIEQAALVGCSWGGKVSMDFALLYPEMVSALVLVAPGLGGYDFTRAGIADKMSALGEAHQQDDKPLMAELITQIWFDGSGRTPEQVNAAMRAQAYEMALQLVSQPQPEGAKEVALEPPAIERLTEISTPTLLLVGEKDAQDIFLIADLLVSKLPHIEGPITIANTAHLPNMERPSHFNSLVLDFLDKIERMV